MTTYDIHTDRLFDVYKKRSTSIDGLKLARFKEAYLRMAQDARYRPSAPSDGVGNIGLSAKELCNPARLDREAAAYAAAFCAEEDKGAFHIGCSDFETNRAFIWAIEAARCLASGILGEPHALRLLQMAIADVEQAAKHRR